MTTPDRDPILIIDNDPLIRETLQALLELEGYAVVPARDGEQGLQRLHNGLTPALIVLDPTEEANQFRRKQLKDPHLASIPMIVWSATSVVETQNGLWSGTIFLRKGIDFDRLLACIRGQQRTSCSDDVEDAGWGSAHGMSGDTSEFLSVERAEERRAMTSSQASGETQPDTIQVQFRLLGVPCVEHHGAPPEYTAVHEALADGTERCNLRDHLIAVGSDCVRACDLNTYESPISRVRRATMV